jgi:hypothetical protein
MSKLMNYIFVDESGDPGKPYILDERGNKIFTGASLYYILTAVCLDSKKLFLLENRFLETKNKFNFKSEVKSETIPLELYKSLLELINEIKIKTYYRLIDKLKYKGKFAIDGKKELHNVFDEYNLAKLISFAVKKENLFNVEVVIDRAERRLFKGKFDNFNNYLMRKTNTKTIKRISYITHVNSEYVNAMQMSDLISGALKDYFTGRNKELKRIIDKNLLIKIW